MEKTVKKLRAILLAMTIILAASCSDWDEHYNQPAPTDVDIPQELPDLAEAVEKQEGYSYISTILESNELESYFNKNQSFTMFLFSDEQFDNTVKAISGELAEVLKNDSTFRMSVVKAAMLRNAFTREEKTSPKGEFKTFDDTQVQVDFDVNPMASVKHGTLYAYSGNIALFPKDYFTIKLHPEVWNDFTMGGGSSRTNLIVPEVLNGNGEATWFKDQGRHLIINIGGIVEGKSYNVINGINYKINLCVGLYKSVKVQFLTYNQSGGDVKIIPNESKYLDADQDFFNDDIQKGMQLVEVDAMPLYNKNGKCKFHIDFRNRTFPPIDGEAPTADQRGLIVDYIEFIPEFN